MSYVEGRKDISQNPMCRWAFGMDQNQGQNRKLRKPFVSDSHFFFPLCRTFSAFQSRGLPLSLTPNSQERTLISTRKVKIDWDNQRGPARFRVRLSTFSSHVDEVGSGITGKQAGMADKKYITLYCVGLPRRKRGDA